MNELKLHAFDLDNTLVPGSLTERGFWKLAEYGELRLPDDTLSHLAARRDNPNVPPQQPGAEMSVGWEVVNAFITAAKVGLSVKALKRASRELAEEDIECIFPMMKDRIKDIKTSAEKFVIVSASEAHLVQGFARAIGAVASTGSRFYIGNDGHLHRTRPPTNGALNKGSRFKNICTSMNAIPESAHGDNMADLPMLEIARRAFAVNPESQLRAIAVARNWDIIDCNGSV